MWDGGGWPEYVSVAERRRRALRKIDQMRQRGREISPVVLDGKTIARTFWGKAWCDNLESYGDYENRIPRGRTYVRNGSVMDLQLAPGRIEALVCGSHLYAITIEVKPVARARWRSICADCADGIDSLVELLQGRLSQGVMERLCRQRTGLFPTPEEITLSCSCPDWAGMCKHVAAVLYGVGARLDARPEMLFRLRQVDEKELLASAGRTSPKAKKAPAAAKVLESGNIEDLSKLFDLDMAQTAESQKKAPAKTAAKPAQKSKAAAAKKKAAKKVAGKGQERKPVRAGSALAKSSASSAKRKPEKKKSAAAAKGGKRS